MIEDLFYKINSTRFSDSFQIWSATLLFLPLAIYFRFVVGTSLVLDKDYRAFIQIFQILGILFVVWLGWKWVFADRLVLSGLEKYLVLFFLVCCLSTAFSINTSLSLEKLIGISAYILGSYLLIDLKRFPALWQGMINALLSTAALSSILILISTIPWIKLYQITPSQILTNPTYLLKALPQLPYSMGLHPSVTAGYLVMILPLGVFQLLQGKKFFWKSLQLIGLALNLCVLILTQSRGGLLGFLCLIAAFSYLYRKEIWTFLSTRKLLGLIFFGVLGLTGIGYFILLGSSRGFSLGGRTIQSRLEIWRVALRIIQEHPWLGTGLGTFGQKYIELRKPTYIKSTIIHAHNQLLQITDELGILDLLSLLLVF